MSPWALWSPGTADWTLVIGAGPVGHAVIGNRSDAPAVVVAADGAAESAVICEFVGDCRPDMKRAGRPGAAGIFPLGFGRQTIAAPGDLDRRLQNSFASFQVTLSTGRSSPWKKEGTARGRGMSSRAASSQPPPIAPA